MLTKEGWSTSAVKYGVKTGKESGREGPAGAILQGGVRVLRGGRRRAVAGGRGA